MALKIALVEIESFLEKTLDMKMPDTAINGIQVANSGYISKIGLGVDFSLELLEAAALQGCNALLVHHGLFWGQPLPLRGASYRKIKQLIENDIALIALHLPLDLHAELGNNAGLLQALSLSATENFGDYKGYKLIFSGTVVGDKALSFEELVQRYTKFVGKPLATVQAGKRLITRVALCSGGALFGLEEAAAKGFDAYVTGDANHIYYHKAKELGIHLLCGGHYLTETFGVKRLANRIQEEFSIPFVFIDLPTGL